MTTFSKVLVANRGEIACRVIRAARQLGYPSVAVFSDADADSPHVQLADEAVHIGAGPAAESYLSIARILDAAKRTGADALHPGYGFLSENPEFAQACVDAGIVFIGPPPAAILGMGDKALAKARMREVGVPTVPGFEGDADVATLALEAVRIGFPLLVKATAGGGGRGIRVVHAVEALAEAITSAQVEAKSAFGNPSVMLERFVERGRHVEVQVFADAHGNVLYFGERDCTAQRRRQKVIEEAPSPIVDAALRARMGEAAVRAARAVGYRGAGTIEFIVDQAGEPYFLEMNTRLQVEHPVTELVAGIDLVQLQLRVAAGERLPLGQADVRLTGHAIEARLYAEDPYDGFAPQIGRIQRFDLGTVRDLPGVRIDAGFADGSRVSPYYDAMLAKLIVRGDTRTDAIRLLRRVLAEVSVFGLRTNARFLRDLLATPEFAEARMHTGSLDHWLVEARPLFVRPLPSAALWALAFALRCGAGCTPTLRSGSASELALSLSCEGTLTSARVSQEGVRVRVRIAASEHVVQIHSVGEREVAYTLDGLRARCALFVERDAVHLAADGSVFVFREPSALRGADTARDSRRVQAPMAGTLARVLTEPGRLVAEGDVLCVVEAMKMEVRVLAARAGVVVAVHRAPGDQVTADELLAEIGDAPEPLTEAEKT